MKSFFLSLFKTKSPYDAVQVNPRPETNPPGPLDRNSELEYSAMLENLLKFRTFDLMPAQFDQFSGPDKSRKILTRIMQLNDAELLAAISSCLSILSAKFTRNSKPYQQMKRVHDILVNDGSGALRNGDFDVIRRMLDTNPTSYRAVANKRVQKDLPTVQSTKG